MADVFGLNCRPGYSELMGPPVHRQALAKFLIRCQEFGLLGVAVTKDLVRIPPGGGEPTSVTEVASRQEIVHGNPQILPGGKAVLFGSAGGSNLGSIEVVTLADHKRKTLLAGAHPRFVPTGNRSVRRATDPAAINAVEKVGSTREKGRERFDAD